MTSELAGGRFRPAARAGDGATAEVWRATDERTGASVALKVARNDASAELIGREAAHASLALSPLLPELVDVGVWAGRPFIALSWLEGSTLASFRGVSTPLTALRVARDVGEALDDLHGLGLAHGDLKPENLLFGPTGRVHLLDLGLATSAWDRELLGATPRYLARGDADLGDARARDMAAVGLVLAELVASEVARSEEPFAAARGAVLPPVIDRVCSALVAPSPGARPSATWLAETAATELRRWRRPQSGMTPDFGPGDADSDDDQFAIDRAVRRVRATYLAARRDDIVHASGVRGDAAPWLAQAISAAQAIDRLNGKRRPEGAEIGPMHPEQLAAWLTALVGSSAASWPLADLTRVPEALLTARLTELARRLPPRAWTYRDLDAIARTAVTEVGRVPSGSEKDVDDGERVRGPRPHVTGDEKTSSARIASAAAATSMDAAEAARLTLAVTRVPPDPIALEEVEARGDAPVSLALACAEALRLSGALGRARSMVLRPPLASSDIAHPVAAEVLRRAGDVDAATTRAKTAIALGTDLDGRARAALARMAIDSGGVDGAAEWIEHSVGAAASEVAGLVAIARGDLAAALGHAARGEALARTDEDRARLRGLIGYACHASDPERARVAFASAVDHAVRAGAVVEEATYRTGEAAAASDLGDLGPAIATGRRAALLWEHLGRPALAARALLACAAAYATAGAAHDATRVAREAIARAREGGDRRAEGYAWWAIADVGHPGAPPALEAARQAFDLVAGAGAVPDDEVRASAKLLRHGPTALERSDIEQLDRRAPAATAATRLEWWGARAVALVRDGGPSVARDTTAVLGELVALADTPCAIWARGPALAAGHDLAAHSGSGQTAQRLLVALGDVARELLRRCPAELLDSVRALPWIARARTAAESGIAPEQAKDLEALVRSLGDRERLGPLLNRVVDALVLWTGVERGLLLLPAPDGRLVPRAARNLARSDLTREQIALSQTLARRALEERVPVVAVDAAGELPSVHQSVHALQLRSVLAVPLIARGAALGVVYLDDRVRRGAFGPKELAWVRTIASVAALALADARDQVLLRRAARRAKRAESSIAETLARREAALDAAERELAHTRGARGTRFEYAEIVGESEAVQTMLRVVDRVTAADVPVLLVGESGCGKELVARAIHRNGPRASRAFVGENCGAIPEGLLESALFGHVRGAFTGADRPRPGLFEVADGGTLFLDEIGEMGLPMQAKLLRVLEDGMVRPLGTERTRKVDVRIVAATHRDLEAMVRSKTFREDLLYRLNIITVRIPPLRERAADIPVIVQHLLKKHSSDKRTRVTRTAMDKLSSFGWPGNVRQLENEIRRAIVLCDGVIDAEHLSPEVGRSSALPRDVGLNVRARVDALEAELVRDALDRTKGNQTKAAHLLGLSRFGLQKMIKRLAIVH